jgi:hypothetical protein
MRPLADDTSSEIEARQIEGWRQMTPAEKLETVAAISRATREMAAAGIRQRHPEAPPREVFLRLALLTLGRDLAACAYPEIDELGLR